MSSEVVADNIDPVTAIPISKLTVHGQTKHDCTFSLLRSQSRSTVVGNVSKMHFAEVKIKRI